MLKEQLLQIRDNNYSTEGLDPFQTAIEMMRYIGSTDAELRDDLIYSTLAKWIRNDVFSDTELKEILRLSVNDDHLHYRLGERETDSVFTRAFSVLITAAVLFHHNRKAFLSDEEILHVKERVLHYARGENDIRGYVIDKGWAHAIAHLADCLNALAMTEVMGETDLKEILEVVKLRMMETRDVFTCEEDERMVTAVCTIFGRGIVSEHFIGQWLESFKNYNFGTNYNDDFYCRINAKHFMRSLFFRQERKGLNNFRLTIANVADLLLKYSY